MTIVRAPLGTALAAIIPRAVKDAHGPGGLVEPQRAKCAPARQVRAPRGQVGGVGGSGRHDFGLKGCALLAAGKLSRTTGTRGSQYWSPGAEAFQRVDSGDRGASTLRRPPQWRALKIHFAHVAPVLRPKHKERREEGVRCNRPAGLECCRRSEAHGRQAGSTVDDRMMLTAARRECCRPGDAHGRTPGVLYIG